MNKNKKTEEVRTEKQGMKKSVKAIIVAAVALIVVAAVLIGVFVIKPAVEKKDNNSDFSFSDIEKPKGAHYEYVSYKGTEMVKDLALIFEQAEKESRESIDKDGYAVKVGDHEISKAEFSLYYMDKYTEQTRAVDESIQSRGQNITGYDPEKLPSIQKHPDGDFNWSDKFVSAAIDGVKSIYTTFDYAIEMGFTLTEQEVSDLINSYSRVERLADAEEGPDGLVSRIYGEGTTYAMFAKREIMLTYAVKFESFIAQTYYDAVTEEELEAEFSKDPDSYKSINLRIYPIQGEYEKSEVDVIKTEQDFLDFATNNYPEEDYNAEVTTKIFNISKEQLEAAFGPEVAEWSFSADRKVGDVELITGQLYEYVVYICELPEYEYSHDLLYCGYWFNTNHKTEDKEKVYGEFEKIYGEMQDKQITPEEFEAYFADTAYICEQRTSRAGDFYFDISNWMTEYGRKPGDTAFFNNASEGVFIVYYLNGNPEDLDWKNGIRTGLSSEKYVAEYEEFEKDYELKENQKVIQSVIKDADVKIKEKIESSANQ